MNKTRIITIILSLIFLVLTISTIYNVDRQKKYIDLKQKQTFNTMQQIIDGKIIFFRKLFASRLTNMIRNRIDFKEAILSSDPKKITKAMDRFYKILKRENRYAKTLHLISPNNISIYRSHKPKKYGDDLTLIRPIIASVNKYKRAKYGFEAGLYASVYRVDIPIFINKKYYGVLEYGVDPNIFISDLVSVSNYIHAAVVIDDDMTNKKIMKVLNKHLEKEVVINHKTHMISSDDIKFFDGVDINPNKSIYKNGKYYNIYLYDLLDFQAKDVGHIILALDTTADHKRYESIIKISFINQIILLGLIFLIVYYAFNYYERKIHDFIEQEKENEKILHQQSKMAAMGEMIGNIAHQWRQPLSAISTISSSIQVEKEYGIYDDSKLNDSMQKIIDQTQYMSKTINDFRDFFKPDKAKKLFNVGDTIQRGVTLVGQSYKNSNIKLELNISSENIELKGYENELIQAVVNILNNAKDQLSKSKQKEKVVQLDLIKANDNIIIKIVDNGGGIDDDVLPKIFEPYFTTKHKSQGTGIGLYMTYEIIVKHFGGKIEASTVEFDYKTIHYTGAQFKIVLK